MAIVYRAGETGAAGQAVRRLLGTADGKIGGLSVRGMVVRRGARRRAIAKFPMLTYAGCRASCGHRAAGRARSTPSSRRAALDGGHGGARRLVRRRPDQCGRARDPAAGAAAVTSAASETRRLRSHGVLLSVGRRAASGGAPRPTLRAAVIIARRATVYALRNAQRSFGNSAPAARGRRAPLFLVHFDHRLVGDAVGLPASLDEIELTRCLSLFFVWCRGRRDHVRRG